MDHEIKILQERYSQNIIEYNDSIQIDDYGDAMHQCTSCQKASKYSLIAYPNLDAELLQNRFNTYFRDDLYGKHKDDDNLILSSGSLSPDEFPLCYALRYPIEFAMLKNWYGYSDSLGHLDSRKAIADLMQLRMPSYDLKVANIALTNGVTNGITTVLQTLKKLIDNEFRILTHFPTYSPFYTSCNSIAPVNTIMLDEGYIKAEQIVNAIDSYTKIILLLGDLNPMGQMISITSLNTIIQVCTEKQIWVIFDEAGAVYPEYDYRNLMKSPYFILLNSDSKKLGVPGLKTGYLVASSDFVKAFYAEASMSYGSPASFFYLFQEFNARFQQFILMGLDQLDQSHLELFRSDYELTLPFLQLLYNNYTYTNKLYYSNLLKKRLWTVNELTQLPKYLISQVLVPQTGVNLSIRISQWDDSYDFFLNLLNETKVSVFPGKCSGIDSGCWVRISYALPDEILHTGIKRIISFLKKHDIYSKCVSSNLYYHYLIENGHYTRYEWLSFWRHIDAVYQCMKNIYLIKHERIEAKTNILFENLSYLHDCGKVISVRLAAVHRIIHNQAHNANNWNCFTDIELLGLKKKLLAGRTFSIDELLAKVSEYHMYFDLLDYDKSYSPNDEDIRMRIFADNKEDIIAIQLLKRPIPVLSATSCIEDIALALLDISDKCSDYLLIDSFTKDKLIEALDKKEQYVYRRYSNGSKNDNTINSDFQIAKHNLNYFI